MKRHITNVYSSLKTNAQTDTDGNRMEVVRVSETCLMQTLLPGSIAAKCTSENGLGNRKCRGPADPQQETVSTRGF